MMLLRSTPTSPFGRKVMLAAHRLGLMDSLRSEPSDPMKADDVLRQDNPLGKMPLLILEDGRRVFDSRVILEHFDHIAGGGRIIPREHDARLAALTTQAMGDGIMDAALLMVYEGRYRPAELRHEPWVDYQRGKVMRGLDAFARAMPDPAKFDVGSISLACMLGYIDWRKQVDWRAEFPPLVGWFDAFRAATPEYDALAD